MQDREFESRVSRCRNGRDRGNRSDAVGFPITARRGIRIHSSLAEFIGSHNHEGLRRPKLCRI